MHKDHSNTNTAPKDFLRPLRQVVLFPLYVYSNYISLLFAPRCRFYPSCSKYAYDAVDTHGVFKGLGLSIIRLCKCHPFNEGGFDPVPEKNQQTDCACHKRDCKS